jgi:hypothetical protein
MLQAVRRWTLIAVILLFVGLVVAAALQFTLGKKSTQCPGPHARLGTGSDVVRCETPRPSPGTS